MPLMPMPPLFHCHVAIDAAEPPFFTPRLRHHAAIVFIAAPPLPYFFSPHYASIISPLIISPRHYFRLRQLFFLSRHYTAFATLFDAYAAYFRQSCHYAYAAILFSP